MERHGWTWPSIRDPNRELARRLGADYQPHSFVVDQDGRVVSSHEGGGDAAVWEALGAEVS